MNSNQGLFQLLMGDDTLLINRFLGRITENDFSRYDRTQSKRLRQIVDRILINNGYGHLVILRQKMYKKRLTFSRNKKHCREQLPSITDLDKKKPDMRLTGEPATCLDNSIINAWITTICIHLVDQRICPNMEEAYKQFGLVAKVNDKPYLHQTTFLKGVFLLDENTRYAWVRLPSFLLKFGKVLTDIRSITQKTWTDKKKCQVVLMSQWRGYGQMKTNWFYKRIGEEIERICEFVDAEPTPLDQYHITQDRTWICDVEWNQFMMDRYQMTPEHMEKIIDTYSQVQPDDLPCMIHCSESLMLLDRDY